MIISSVRTSSFRNLNDSATPTCAPNVFLVGENGQGKSNFLEALYFCSYASSFRGARDLEIVRNGERDFAAALSIAGDETVSSDILVKFEKGKKTVSIDGKKIQDRKDLLSVVPCIIFCHEDMEFVSGSPERRRWFFDQVLSMSDPVYLDDLRRYRWVLKSRNSALRDNASRKLGGDLDTLLDALDRQYALYGIKLMEKRHEAARLFSQVFAPLYRDVSGIAGMEVCYAPSWKIGGEEEVFSRIAARRAADAAAGLSLSGPHRDRYAFCLGGAGSGADFAAKASTGQRRLLALLLRVAQARRYAQASGKNPILLLDDVLLEMDGEKRRRFLLSLPPCDQAFYTFLPDEPYQRYRSGDTLVYRVYDGKLQAE